MKKVFTVFSFLICSLVFSQNLYWYDVMLEVDSKNVSTVAGLVDDFYSNHPKPSNVNVAFSSVASLPIPPYCYHIIIRHNKCCS